MKGECSGKRKTKFSGLAMPNRSLFHEKMRIISGIAEILHRRACISDKSMLSLYKGMESSGMIFYINPFDSINHPG